MAAAVDAPPAKPSPANPCCSEWKGKCSKLEEGRKYLKEAVKMLTEQVEKIQAENISLKKALTEERTKAGREKEGRAALEGEVCSLKLEISSLKQKGDADVDGKRTEVKLLEGRILEGEKTIGELKRLVEKEKLRADAEKKKAEAEKRSAAEAWKFVKAEKARADEERKLANVEGKKAEACRLKLEEVKKVADEERAKLASLTLMLEDTKRSLEAERSSVLEERNADLWRGKLDQLRNLVEEGEKNFKVEKSRADGLALELEDARQRIGLLQIQVAKSAVPQNPSDAPGILCNDESNDFDVGSFFENIDKDVDPSDLVSGFLESDDAIERIKVEKNCVDLSLVEAEELRKVAEENKKLAAEEKLRADHLSLQLEESLHNSEALQKQLHEILSRGNEEMKKVKLLEKELKDEKQKAAATEKKHADSAMKKLEELKKLAEGYRKMATEEKSRADQLFLVAEENKKLTAEEKLCADHLSLQLEESLRNSEVLQKQLHEILSRGDEEMKKVKLLEKELKDEKQRAAATEKKHADSAMKKVEELKKLAEGYRKMAIKEKSRADQFSLEFGKRRRLAEENQMIAPEEEFSDEYIAFQLKEDRRRIEEMQKQIQLLSTSRNMVQQSVASPGKCAEVKHLERQLKHEKRKLKIAKQVAKMENSRNLILIQEFNRLKLDFVQIFSRLDVVGRSFSPYADGTNGVEKAAELALMQHSKLRNSKDFGTCQAYTRRENEILKPDGVATDGCNFLGGALHSAAPCFSLLNAKVSESISGIDSELEPLVGGSNRQLLQSSAMNSSSGSFSDDRLMGSQEKAANVISSPNIGQHIHTMRPKVPAMSGEVTEIQQHAGEAPINIGDMRCIDVVAKNNAFDQTRRISDLSTSCEILSSGKNLYAPTEDKLVVSKNRSKRKRQSRKFLEENMPKRGRLLKKTESFHKQNSPVEHLASRTEWEKIIYNGDKVCHDANLRRQASSSGDEAVAVPSPCREGVNKHFQFQLTVAGLEDVNGNNYMRLLDLDNPAEEESYRRAMERPLSPSLPEVRLPNAEYVGIYGAKSIKGDSSNRRLSHENHISSPNSLDKVQVNVTSNNLKSKSFATTACGDLSNNLRTSIPCNSSDKLLGKILHNRRSDKSVDKLKTVNANTSIAKNTAFLSKVGSAASDLRTSIDIFADTEDSQSISRVLYTSRNWMACPLETETRSLLEKVLHALKKENISTKEKASAFFTILMHHTSAYNSGKIGNYFGREFVQHVDAFAKEIRSVLSDYHTRNLLEGSFSLDELLATMDNFLTDGRVMTCADPSFNWGENNPCLGMVLDGKNEVFLCKSASVEQFLAGSIILASICEATDTVGFISEVSYNLLRERRFDDSVTLKILHIFAHLGSEKLFCLKQTLPEMTVLKSIVMLLEGANKSCVQALSSSHDNLVQFHPLGECPFSKDVVPIDNLATMLLEKLHSHALFCVVSSDSSHCKVLSHANKSMLGQPLEKIGSRMQNKHDASCGLTKWMGDPSDMATDYSLCDLCDILSLLELLASRMSWEWTYGVIVQKLLEMLEGPHLDVFVIGILSLLGQLGRFGVGSSGYEDKGVENLRCKVSGFLRLETTAQVALPVQITAVSALLGLLTFDARQAVLVNLEKPIPAIQSVYVDLIQSWFSLLDKDQQAPTLKLLQSVAPAI